MVKTIISDTITTMGELAYNLPKKHSSDYYYLDNLFLTKNLESEEVFQINNNNPIYLSFLMLRGLLYLSSFQKKPKLNLKNYQAQRKLLKMDVYDKLNSLFDIYPRLVATQVNLFEDLPFQMENLEANSGFFFKMASKKKFQYCFGSILQNEATNVMFTLEKIYKSFHLIYKQGSIFLRTNHSSYFFELKPMLKNNVLFVQEKKRIFTPFLYFYIDANSNY